MNAEAEDIKIRTQLIYEGDDVYTDDLYKLDFSATDTSYNAERVCMAAHVNLDHLVSGYRDMVHDSTVVMVRLTGLDTGLSMEYVSTWADIFSRGDHVFGTWVPFREDLLDSVSVFLNNAERLYMLHTTVAALKNIRDGADNPVFLANAALKKLEKIGDKYG